MKRQETSTQTVLLDEERRPVSQYELARMVVTVLQELTREEETFTTYDVTREVRRRHPDRNIRHYDQTWDGTPAPWQQGEPYRRGHVAVRGVQSLVHELMGVHLTDEYTCKAMRSAFGRCAEQYVPLTAPAGREICAA